MLAFSVDPSFVAAAASIAAAFMAAAAAVGLHWLGQRQAVQERKRRACAKALADALSWLELPYRVRRRADNSAITLSDLAGRLHDLQEALLYHESWLRIEVPGAHEVYSRLVRAVKQSALEPLREAWAQEPITGPGDMSIGPLNMGSVEAEVNAFSKEVKKSV